MSILLLFAFLSGLVTIFAPCIWPLLPIILSASSTGGKAKPLGITLGIVISFAFFTLTLAYIIKIIPFDPDILRLVAVIVIGFFGLTLIIPQLNQLVEGWVSRLSSKLNATNKQRSGLTGGFITGLALGIVWSPCAGPILATIATLAATTHVNTQVILVTISYVIGIGIPLFLFALLGQRIFNKSRLVNKYTGRVQQVFGLIMIITALAIATNYDKVLQAKLLNFFPSYSNFLTKLESNQQVQKQLDQLKGNPSSGSGQVGQFFDTTNNYGQAPEFTGITHWLNLPAGDQALTMSKLRGKVVLVDFWTYTCINCIRTLPYVTSWYEKYKDKGFVVIGVHTPEFEFEKKTSNVEQALKQYKINYPVAQDNDYGTWNAYNNQYWPAKYLVDAKGVIRYEHFGEGEYDQTEKVIQQLLKEAGQNTSSGTLNLQDQTPQGFNQTPETYLGSGRMQRFASNEQMGEGKQTFTVSEPIPTHYIAYNGTWNVQQEYATASKNSQLILHFNADKVFLVITPHSSQDVVKVYLDDKLVTADNAGKDVVNGQLKLDEPRLYELINLKGNGGDHTLRLDFGSDGTQLYAFTFG